MKKKEDPMLRAWKDTLSDDFDQADTIGLVVRKIEEVLIESDLTFGEAKMALKIARQNLSELKIGDGFKKHDAI